MTDEYRQQYDYDFFLSRRGSVAEIAREVADVLTESGYRVIVQDYDFLLGDSVIERMHEGVKNARDLIILFTRDYEQSPMSGIAAQLMSNARVGEEGHALGFAVLHLDEMLRHLKEDYYARWQVRRRGHEA